MAILQVASLTIHEHGFTIIDNLSFTVEKGEQWAIAGHSGTGKTTLLHALAGRHHHSGSIRSGDDAGGQKRIVLVEQQHRFKNLSNLSTFYYQQRFNASDADDAITVKEDLNASAARAGGHEGSREKTAELLEIFGLRQLAEAKLIQLSNGENKRLQIAKALLLEPEILLLDSPLTGLDAGARTTLVSLLENISRRGIHVIMVTGPAQIPSFITHILHLEGGGKNKVYDRQTFLKEAVASHRETAHGADVDLMKALVSRAPIDDFRFAVIMRHVSIRYKDRQILADIDWEVAKGERWALSGPNGAGKSTLLSLINADNPQAYANEIYLFDRRKGSGESIWDIKKKIGYLSPELHLYFETSANCFDVVASGLFDTIGLFRLLNEVQEELVTHWMKLLRIDHLRRKLLFQLSNSEQRMVLLARALVKNPPLLILDEPCQGLDDEQVFAFRNLIDEICLQGDKTLIYVSHYTHEIPACVDHFIRLENGRRV